MCGLLLYNYYYCYFFKVSYVLVLSLTALENLVEHRISGFPVIDDEWKLVCICSLFADLVSDLL